MCGLQKYKKITGFAKHFSFFLIGTASKPLLIGNNGSQKIKN